MEPIIVAEKLSKAYQITHGQDHYSSLRDQLMTVFLHPVKWLKSKAVGAGRREIFWALRDASFSINRGEVVGVIGANGAGKSTLLKILNRIVFPTDGVVTISGRIASLLEVGTGFHPELTGRENIFFSGAVLGMKRGEIIRKFDDIVAFAEMEQFLDMPVKKYSSGMHVRLAFAVAAHMEPDILLIDEVLAVGDMNFQKKCLAKIHEAATAEGRTIFFVSHNLAAVQSLCTRTLVLERGVIVFDGETQSAIDYYQSSQAKEGGTAVVEFAPNSNSAAQLRSVSVLNSDLIPTTQHEVGMPFSIEAHYDVNQPKAKFWIHATLVDENGSIVWRSADTDKQPDLLPGRSVGHYQTRITLPFDHRLALNKGLYSLEVKIVQNPTETAVFNLAFSDQLKRFHPYPGSFLVGEPWQDSSGKS